MPNVTPMSFYWQQSVDSLTNRLQAVPQDDPRREKLEKAIARAEQHMDDALDEEGRRRGTVCHAR